MHLLTAWRFRRSRHVNVTEETFLDFNCPHCGAQVSFPGSCEGSLQECHRCTEVLIVPPPGTVNGGKLKLPISTPRLVLRRLRGTDERELVEFMGDEESFRFFHWMPMDEAGVTEWLERDQGVRITRAGEGLCLAIELAQEKKLVGVVYLQFNDSSQQCLQFHVLVRLTHRRQGIGTEAVLGALEFGFENLGVHRVAVQIDKRNVPAIRMVTKAGLRWEGEFLKATFVKGEWVTTVEFALLQEEFVTWR